MTKAMQDQKDKDEKEEKSKQRASIEKFARRFTLNQEQMLKQASGKKKQEKAIVDDKMQTHIEFFHKRLKAIVDSKLFRKIFSATFYAFVALI